MSYGQEKYDPEGPMGKVNPKGQKADRAAPWLKANAEKDPHNPKVNGGYCMAFVRLDAVAGFGHVAFAFQAKRRYGYTWRGTTAETHEPNEAYYDDMWFVGSLNNQVGTWYTPALYAGFLAVVVGDPVVYFKKLNPTYDAYKLIPVERAQPDRAEAALDKWREKDYVALTQNCLDAAYDILKEYGALGLPNPAKEIAPNIWFEQVRSQAYPVKSSVPPAPVPAGVEWVHLYGVLSR